ncbi:MAG TPA: hypothetical protein VHJ39_10120 [Solirubrobacteraceae bacterium]|jgi:hypothetical protein|nr:hypothetical protein [Solirubrobacteraceae bacterium]
MASATRTVLYASDPSVDGALIAWHLPGQPGVLVRDGQVERVGGAHPALGGGRLAVIRDGTIHISSTSGPAFNAVIPAPGADAVAVSARWVAWRARDGDADAIIAAALPAGPARLVLRLEELGRPVLEGDRLAFHAAGHRGGRIVLADLEAGTRRIVRRERRAQLLNPSLLDGRLLYVRARYSRQELRLGPLSRRAPRRDRRVWSTTPTGFRDNGYERGRRKSRHNHRKLWPRPRRGLSASLWTTALAEDAAYVTRLRQAPGRGLVAEILRVDR